VKKLKSSVIDVTWWTVSRKKERKKVEFEIIACHIFTNSLAFYL